MSHLGLVTTNADGCYSNVGNSEGLGRAYEGLLKSGLTKKTCSACNRHMNDSEMKVFEKFVSPFFMALLFS